MRGYRKIADDFHLKALNDVPAGMFAWRHRMGIHLAFHTNPINNLLHIVMPPFNTLGVLLCFYPFTIPGLMIDGQGVSFALAVLLGTFLIYSMIDILAAVITVFLAALLYPLCGVIYGMVGGSIPLMVVIGLAIFFVALWVQVGIGHSIFEEGIGDEDENIGEVYDTFNPLYFTLLPVYSILDVLFMIGYRKKAGDQVRSIANELRPLVVARKTENPAGKGI